MDVHPARSWVAPAQVVAAIPAPVVPLPAGKQYGEPTWVKVIKTTTHNANNVVLAGLISDDSDNDGKADWQNSEPDEVESEWKLLQANSAGNAAKDELQGGADDMGRMALKTLLGATSFTTTRPTVTRPFRPVSTGKMAKRCAMRSNPATDLHGHHSLTAVEVAEAGGDTYHVDCAARSWLAPTSARRWPVLMLRRRWA